MSQRGQRVRSRPYARSRGTDEVSQNRHIALAKSDSLIVSGRRENQWSEHMRHYVSFNRFLLVGAALLFVTPFELPSRWLPPPIQQADKLSEIRWEFDTGG